MLQNSNFDLTNQEMFFQYIPSDRESLNASCGSMTVGDYTERIVFSSSYNYDPNYKFTLSKSSKYRELQELIISWIEEPGDYDIRVWPEIEKELYDNKLNFPDDT